MLILVFLWVSIALAADSVLDLSDPWQQLAFTRELARDAQTADEAAVALMALTEQEITRAPARSELYTLCVREGTHPGWRDIYADLLGERDLSGEGRRLLSVRYAEALVADPASRAQGVRQLQVLVGEDAGDTAARLALGRALLRDGRPDEARAIYLGTDGGAAARRGAIIALLALGRMEDVRVVARDFRAESGSALAAALETVALADRVRAIASEGYPELAEGTVRREDPGVGDLPAWIALSEAWLRSGQPARAAAALEAAAAAHPGEEDLRKRWTAALLEAGHMEAAREAAGEDEDALQLLYAVQLVTAGQASSEEARAGQIERAHRLAPRQPTVLRLYTELQLQRGEAEAAREALSEVLALRPGDPELLALYVRVALAADAPEEALAAHRQSMLSLSDLDLFWERAGALAGLHSMVAEHYKAREQTDRALWHYRVALSMRPGAWEYYAGIGGVYWSAGDLEAARVAYREAYERNPESLPALQGIVGISLALGQPRAALKILDETALQAPQLLDLREEARIALLLEDTIQALDAGLEEDAMRAYRDLLVRYPDNPRILHSLGDALLRAGKAPEALDAYQRARNFDPDNSWLALAEANCLIELGRLKWAQEVLDGIPTGEDEELDRQVRGVQARVLRTEGDRLWHELGRDRDAFEHYARALELDPDPWTLTALAGLYLEHRQPGVALAFFDAARAADPGNSAALLGRVRALQALGRLDEAREDLEALERGAADDEAWAVQESMEVQAAIAEVDALRLKGDTRRAQQLLEDIAGRYPDSPHVDAAMGSIYLDQGQPRQALKRAERALSIDPTHGRALVVAMDAGLALGRMSDVVLLFERALEVGGGERARTALENAEFAASVEAARQLSDEGRWKEARDKLDELREVMADNPDHWALLAGGYLSLGLSDEARVAYEQALELDSDHIPSLIGIASVYEARGFLRAAERWLEEQYALTADPQIGLELARVQGRLARWRAGLATLEQVRAQEPGPPEMMAWNTVRPLPVLPLPSGEVPEDLPPAVLPGVASGVPLKRIDDLEAELSAAHYPYGDVGGGSLGRTGEVGENWMTSGLIGASIREIYAGPFRLQADVLSVFVDDGVHEEEGIGASAGLATASERRVGLSAQVGTSPIGFEAGSYLTWLGSLRFGLDPRVEIAADTGRTPATDSLLSWAGLVDESTGLTYGLVSFTWAGGWLALSSPSHADGGVRYRSGTLGGLAMDPVARREFTGWVGQRMGSDEFAVRIGGNFTWLTHDDQVDGFVIGQSGVFTPLRYTAGLVRGDMLWAPDFSATTVCAGASLGMQSLQGQESLYFRPGTHRAFAGGAGLRFPITDEWGVAIDARTETTGSDWTQQSILFRLGYVPAWTGLPGMKPPSQIHGTGIGNMSACAG